MSVTGIIAEYNPFHTGHAWQIAEARRRCGPTPVIVAMSGSLGLATIAEGVETDEQWHVLLGSACQAGQGYLFGRPLPLEQWDALLLGESESV